MHLVGFALHMGLECTEALIGEHKAGQVPRVGICGFQNGLQFLLETAQTESFMSAGPAGPGSFPQRTYRSELGKEHNTEAHPG